MSLIKPSLTCEHQLLSKFIQHNPFATIMLEGKGLPTTYTTVLYSNNPADNFLYTHIRKDNPQYKYIKENIGAEIIFESKNPYVKNFNNREIINNYSSVIVSGNITFQSDNELEISLKNTYHVLREFYGYDEKLFPINQDFIDRQLDVVIGLCCKPTLIKPS